MSVLLRRVATGVALTAVGAAVAAGLAPLVLREQPAIGSAVAASPTLTGPAQAAEEGLRGLGYTCADTSVRSRTVTRVCTRVHQAESAEVRMLVTTETGAVRQVSTTVDGSRSARTSHSNIFAVVVDAIGLGASDRGRIRATVAADASGLVTLDEGSFFLRAGVVSESQLRVAPAGQSSPGLSIPALTGSVDALAASAGDRGYTCVTPQVRSVRSCTRSEGGYTYHLWMQGTNTSVAELDLEVLAAYRTRTRRHWLDEMKVVVSWVDPDQGRKLSSWLTQQAAAPGADSYVDGLAVSFFVRTDEYVKETFGGVHA